MAGADVLHLSLVLDGPCLPAAASISFRPAPHDELEPLRESDRLGAVDTLTRLRPEEDYPLIAGLPQFPSIPDYFRFVLQKTAAWTQLS